MSTQFTCRMPSPMKRRPESSAGERREGGRKEISIRKETQLSFSWKKRLICKNFKLYLFALWIFWISQLGSYALPRPGVQTELLITSHRQRETQHTPYSSDNRNICLAPGGEGGSTTTGDANTQTNFGREVVCSFLSLLPRMTSSLSLSLLPCLTSPLSLSSSYRLTSSLSLSPSYPV